MLNSPTGSNWLKVSPLEVLITRACDPSLPEPNYAVHIEVADYINNKKANTCASQFINRFIEAYLSVNRPREAAMIIARLTNNRNPHVAILSLALLDTLVQSCGYPFHLQISTKEFLNELVRRFPERPPPFPGPVMSRILDLIHTWKETICVDSRWKDDLKNIWDMHRLLMFKGYRFRDSQQRQPSLSSASVGEISPYPSPPDVSILEFENGGRVGRGGPRCAVSKTAGIDTARDTEGSCCCTGAYEIPCGCESRRET